MASPGLRVVGHLVHLARLARLAAARLSPPATPGPGAHGLGDLTDERAQAPGVLQSGVHSRGFRIAERHRSRYKGYMSRMMIELYDALLAAGAPEDKARAAATAMAENSLATKADINRIERELLVLKWMTGLLLAGVASLVLESFFI